MEHKIVMQALEQYCTMHEKNSDNFFNSKDAQFHYKIFQQAFRSNIAHHLTGESYRLFSIRTADSTLFQWFIGLGDFGKTQAISKSSLERYEKHFDEKLVSKNIHEWLAEISDEKGALKAGLPQSITIEKIFLDSTCVKANIHFPVDWVLLRDAVRSLLLAIKTIRAKGLKHRMIEPQIFLKQMNKLCIQMTQIRRKANSKKQRKIIFRAMKKLSNCIAKHGKRYRELLIKEWGKTDWSFKQIQQVKRRIDNILEQLPAAVKQAHERIIGERLVPTEDKILSLYDKDTHVIIRGKAGNEVEFGQGLLLAEQADGLIVDWEFFTDQPPSDSKLLEPALKRIKKHYGPIQSACADRAFSDKDNTVFMRSNNIYNAVCPRSPQQLQEKLSDPIFLSLQTRRSQTEARIGIFKNVFLGRPLRSRITSCKKTAITWCILTHNLWLLSRMAIDIEKSMLKKAA